MHTTTSRLLATARYTHRSPTNMALNKLVSLNIVYLSPVVDIESQIRDVKLLLSYREFDAFILKSLICFCQQ